MEWIAKSSLENKVFFSGVELESLNVFEEFRIVGSNVDTSSLRFPAYVSKNAFRSIGGTRYSSGIFGFFVGPNQTSTYAKFVSRI